MCLMEGTPICGYEITLLILSQMFNIAILVIRSDFLWVSTQVPPRECPVVIIQNTSGEFLGTKSTCGVHPVSVGTVPKISVNKRRNPVLIKSSTPDDYSRHHTQEFDNMLKEKLSPIPENDDNLECRSVDSKFDESVDLLASVNKVEMTKDTVQCNSAHSTNDVAKGRVHLNIKDIGNDMSDGSILNNTQLLTNTTNKELVVKSVGAGNDCGKNETFVSGLDVSAETSDLNDSIDYRSVDEEIAKSTTQQKTEISAGDTSERKHANGGNESTLTASKLTDTDDEKSVTIPASTSTDGSTLVEKMEFPLPQFFPDSDDISTQNNSSSCGEKTNKHKDVLADDEAEITDPNTEDGKGEKQEEINDNTKNDDNGEKEERNTEDKKADSESVASSVDNIKSKETKIQMNDEKEDSKSESEQEEKDGKLEVPSEAAMPSPNYDISVKSPTIHPNNSDDSEDNEDPLSLSEIPTSQLDTTLENSSDEENDNVEECSDANTTVDEGRDKEDTASKSKKKKRLGTTGPVKNVNSKKPKKSPKKEVSVKIKKGGKEEIADKKKLAKVTRKNTDGKEDKNEDRTHNNDGEIDEESEEKVKPKWSFPPKKAESSSKKKKKNTLISLLYKWDAISVQEYFIAKVDTMIIYIISTKSRMYQSICQLF